MAEPETKNIDVSNLKRVGSVTVNKLQKAGIHTLMDLILQTPTYLKEALRYNSVEKALKLQEKARLKLQELGLIEKDFLTGEEMLERRKKVEHITTSSKNLDKLLMGGIETRAVTEFYGEYGTGKTQLCHVLSVNVQLPKDKGGLNSSALYLDTEKTFRPSRIAQIASARNIKPMDVLRKIHVAPVFNTSHLMLLVRNLDKYLEKTKARFIAIDSAVAPFRSEYVGRGVLAERQQLLNQLMRMLVDVAELYNVAVVITNQVQVVPDPYYTLTRAIGGHVVAHATTYRVYLRKSKDPVKVAKMIDSPYHPPGEVLFTIDESGIVDVKE